MSVPLKMSPLDQSILVVGDHQAWVRPALLRGICVIVVPATHGLSVEWLGRVGGAYMGVVAERSRQVRALVDALSPAWWLDPSGDSLQFSPHHYGGWLPRNVTSYLGAPNRDGAYGVVQVGGEFAHPAVRQVRARAPWRQGQVPQGFALAFLETQLGACGTVSPHATRPEPSPEDHLRG